MNLVNCYRLLGLPSDATPEQVKATYRHLARQYHPDINRGNQEAQAHFIRLTEAYKFLINNLPKTRTFSQNTPPASKPISVTSDQPKAIDLSEYEQQLKWDCYKKLQQLLQEKRIIRAIALVEGLGERLAQDPEVRQWQAIIYQQWGKSLLDDGQFSKAKIYFKKALRTDPYNRSLKLKIQNILQEFEPKSQVKIH